MKSILVGVVSTRRITITVTAVEGRKVSFSAVARDDAEELSCGDYGRFVIDLEKLRGRVAAKAAKIQQA